MAFYRFQLQSPLSSHDVLDRIRGLAREQPGFRESLREVLSRRPADNPPFFGSVDGNGFRLQRVIGYKNSFLPHIKGHVEPSLIGSTIDVVMSPHPSVTVFMVLWVGLLATAAVAMWGERALGQALAPLGLVVFGIVLTLCGFYPEALKARRILEEAVGKR